MAEISESEIEEYSNRLFIHFGVEGHFLKLDTFIATAESARKIVEALDETFFHGSLEYELVVLPPEPGTFLSKLALWVGGGATAIFGFINSDVGNAYVEGLTGQPATYWASQAGKATHDLIFTLDGEEADLTGSIEKSDEKIICHFGANIVTEMTRGILEKDESQLEKIGMGVGKLPWALDARADFYFACLDDPDVKKIGFSQEDEFPILRNSFAERAIRPDRKEDDPTPWEVSIESIYVTSPNWDYRDQKSRQWKGKDQLRRDCYFVVEDAEFWDLVRRKHLHIEAPDNLKVQWAYQTVGERQRNRRVLRVLEFNGEKLADPLSPSAIRAILGNYQTADAIHRNEPPSLFD